MSKPALGLTTIVGFGKETVAGTEVVADEWLDLISESLDYQPVLFEGPELFGDRQKRAEMKFVSHNDGGGSVICRPRPDHMNDILDLILGVQVVDWRPITDNAELPTASVEVTKADQNTLTLVGCKVNTAKFSSVANQPLLCELSFLAMSGTRDSAVAVETYSWITGIPYMHSSLVFAAVGFSYLDGAEVRSVEFTMNNNLDAEGFANSVDRQVIPEGVFGLNGSVEIPYNTTTKAYWAAMVTATKVKFSLAYTSGGSTVTFNFVAKMSGNLPQIAGPESQWVTIDFVGVVDATDPLCMKALAV
ncbi:MAG: hypothetical protein FVQ80_11475 [Planctomycetes bacterium]|nr:hypothetical protein [Planctomycetota bacterium]